MHGDPSKVTSFLKDRIQKDAKANTPRQARDRADLQNVMFYRGGEDNQWTVWDASAQCYVPRPTRSTDEAALPEWFFRANSNLFATKIDGVCSILNQSQPAQEITPERDEDGDRAAAEVAEAALPVLYGEADYESLRPQIHKLVALTNGVGVHVYYDNDERHGMDEMPILQCQNPACRQFFMPHEVGDGEPCPECEQPTVDWAQHPNTNQPLTQKFPRGKLALRLLTNFEFSLPRAAREFHEDKVSWVAAHGRMDPTEVVALWDKAKGKVDDRSTSVQKGSTSQSIAYSDRMRGLSAPGGAVDQPSAGGSNLSPSGPVIWMVWADPVDDETFYFPEGLYAVMLEDELVLESGPLPLKDDRGRPRKNVLLRTWQSVPGSAWGKPPGDDLVPLQKQLNLCMALAFLILMNDAAPSTWIPDTLTLMNDISGMPGSVNQFKSLHAGDKPIFQQGAGFTESLKWFIEFLVQQFDVVSKLNAVLMGARPEGANPTLGEVQILQERGLASFKEPLDALVDFEKRLSLTLLWTARQSMWSPRFYTVKGENGAWDVKQFLGTDLEGQVSINVEPASAWPSSQLLMNLRLSQAIEHGIINPADPEVQQTYLTLNDLTAFKKSVNEDRKQIARHLDAWKNATDPQQITPPDPLWNLPLHFFYKVQWLRTEEAELMQTMLPAIYGAIRQHIAQIQQLMTPAAPPAPGPGQPGGPPPDGKAVDHAVTSGALKPKHQGPPTGGALEAAQQSGALQPAGTVAAMQDFHAITGGPKPSLNEMLARRALSKSSAPKAMRGPHAQAGSQLPTPPISASVV